MPETNGKFDIGLRVSQLLCGISLVALIIRDYIAALISETFAGTERISSGGLIILGVIIAATGLLGLIGLCKGELLHCIYMVGSGLSTMASASIEWTYIFTIYRCRERPTNLILCEHTERLRNVHWFLLGVAGWSIILNLMSTIQAIARLYTKVSKLELMIQVAYKEQNQKETMRPSKRNAVTL